MDKKIAIIGAGHIGRALATGFIHSKKISAQQLIISNPSGNNLGTLQNTLHIAVSTDNKEAVRFADWIILAVKPMFVKAVLSDMKEEVKKKLLLSVAAGISLVKLEAWTDSKQKIVRLMPNIPVVLQKGVIGSITNNAISLQEKKLLTRYLSLLGTIVWCGKEEQLDTISLISGCGPALVSFYIDMFYRLLHDSGFEEKTAHAVALQTGIGTLSYLQETGKTPLELQNEVATKGGVTEQIIQSLNEGSFPAIFEKSIEKGREKIQEMSEGIV